MGDTGAHEFSQKGLGHVSLCVLSGIRVVKSARFHRICRPPDIFSVEWRNTQDDLFAA